MPGDERARVLVADDHADMRDRVVKILGQAFSVIGAVGDGEQLVAAEAALQPDVLVVDCSMPRLSGLEAAACLRQRGSQVPFVCLTACDEPGMLEAAWDAGALGYVNKAALALDLVPAVHAALQGRRFASVPLGAAGR